MLTSSKPDNTYRGRFAPSPTGPLHFGSLIAAVASYLDAKSNNGQWLLRIENIDPPREQAKASEQIIKILDDFGFEWDEKVIFQADNESYFDEIINSLISSGKAYYCNCSRKEIAAISKRTPAGMIYPGTCRNGGLTNKNRQPSIRIKTSRQEFAITDIIQGEILQNIQNISGDFIIKRADKLIAYNLAVVVDDYLSGITDVIRGYDLILCTSQQIHLQKVLNYHTPRYGHIPIAVDSENKKLSKQNLAQPITTHNIHQQIFNALVFLGQTPPKHLDKNNLKQIWEWAINNWNVSNIPKTDAIPTD